MTHTDAYSFPGQDNTEALFDLEHANTAAKLNHFIKNVFGFIPSRAAAMQSSMSPGATAANRAFGFDSIHFDEVRS